MPEVRLGTMGFAYVQWADVFYPRAVKPIDYLAFYARFFDTVELDTTFHATPSAHSVERWRSATPVNFRFCVKAPREVTHADEPDRRADVMLKFLNVMRHLERKLAVILLQFPPTFTIAQHRRLETLLDVLPGDLRYAVEFRHNSWRSDRTNSLLGERAVAWAAADYGERLVPVRVTGDFLYVRWVGIHGRFPAMNEQQMDVGSRLADWARQIEAAPTNVKQVYGFFNNDYAGYSIATCNEMKRILGLEFRLPELGRQGSLFD